MGNNDLNCSLEQELAQKAGELASQHYMREKHLVELTLKAIADRVVSKEKEITAMVNASNKALPSQVLREIVIKEILRSADGVLWCSNYSERAKSDQSVNVFTGTHWETVSSPLWMDFVDCCAGRCGVSESQLMNPGFMNPLYEGAAFNLKGFRRQPVPDGEVWLNLPNGTLIISSDGSVKMREHNRDDLFFYCLGYAYDAQAECPTWHNFLDHVLPDEKAQLVFAEFLGYSLMRDHRYEKMLWLFGPGQNGKSTALEIVEALLGHKNISYLSLDNLTNDETKRAGFEHKLLNISSETGRDINANVLKMLTSGESVTVELKYVNPRQITDYGKLLASTNQLPKAENTAAFFRRLIILPFQVTITEEEKDVMLAEKLKLELPGILNWILAALPGLMKRNAFSTCEISERALEEYKLESDNVNLFQTEMLEPSDTFTHGQDLFKAYVTYCKTSGLLSLGRTNFYKRLDNLTGCGEKKRNVMYFKLKLIES